MLKAKIKKGDLVTVVAGKDKGREGQILSVIRKQSRTSGFRVVVEGVNRIKKHIRANPQAGQEGGIVEKESPLDISNVAIVNKATGKADKIAYKILENGKKVRVYRSTGEMVDI